MKKRWWLVTATVMAVALAACGGDDDDAESTGDEPTEEVATTTSPGIGAYSATARARAYHAVSISLRHAFSPAATHAPALAARRRVRAAARSSDFRSSISRFVPMVHCSSLSGGTPRRHSGPQAIAPA